MTTHMVSIQRISDQSYIVETANDQTKPTVLTIGKDAQIEGPGYHLVHKAAHVLYDSEDEGVHPERTFELAGCRWQFKKVSSDKHSWSIWALSTLTSMVHSHQKGDWERLAIVPVYGYGSYINPSSYLRSSKVAPAAIAPSFDEIKAQKDSPFCSLTESIEAEAWEKGVRGFVPDLTDISKINRQHFSDPYTRLATLAYQRYETAYFAKDAFKPSDCDLRIVLTDKDELILLPKDSVSKEDHRRSAEGFRAFLYLEYGKEKIKQIEHRYNVDLEELIESEDGLTPSHVYRFNMGVQGLTVQETERTLCSLKHLAKAIKGARRNHQIMRVKDWLSFWAANNGLPLLVARNLFRQLDPDARAKDLLDWIEKQNFASGRLRAEDMSPAQLNILMSLLTVSRDERQLSYTGRRIHGHIRSYYTVAEDGTYKPWIEQQELLQTYELVMDHRCWQHFYEKLDIVICKRQLVREDPEQGFTVGTLIPAPPKNGGERRWYKLTRCMSNNYGNFSYTFEPLGNDQSLPTITNYRSTASSEYHLRWAPSLLSDFNRLNSPGYEGLALLDSYMKPYYNARTIPLWVGYLTWAEQQIKEIDRNKVSPGDLNKLISTLNCVQGEYLGSLYSHAPVLSLRQIIKKHDGILNSLHYESLGFASESLKRTAKEYHTFFEKEITSTAQPSTQLLLEAEQIIAKQLKAFLDQFLDCDKLRSNRKQVEDLLGDLDCHLLSDTARKLHKDLLLDALRSTNHRIDEFHDETLKLIEQSKLKQALATIRKWHAEWNKLALATGEAVEKKQACDLVFTGHSLGGACAQIGMVRYLVNKRRIPLPGRYVQGYFIDAPKINIEDNAKYKKFGVTNSELFQALGVRWRIAHYHEYGDLLALYGSGDHLGATHSTKEEAEVSAFQWFSGTVLRRLDSAKEKHISESSFAHETQFRGKEAKKASTFLNSDLNSIDGDYLATHFSSRILGMIDSKGSDQEWKGSTNPGADLLNSLWGVPNYLPVDGESWRVGSFFDSSRKDYALKRIEDDRASEWSDTRSVLAVTEEGVVSKQTQPWSKVNPT